MSEHITIEEMFELVLKEGYDEFFYNLKSWYERKGWLSNKQKKILEDKYAEIYLRNKGI